MGTKETFYVTKESISHRICLEHQYGRRFIVLLHQYGRRDVTEYSLPRPSSFEGWSRDRAKSSEVIKENEMTSWRKSLYQPSLMHAITEIRSTILVTPVTYYPML